MVRAHQLFKIGCFLLPLMIYRAVRALRFLAKNKVFFFLQVLNRNSTLFILLFEKVDERRNLVFILKEFQFSNVSCFRSFPYGNGGNWQWYKVSMYGNYIGGDVSQTTLVAFTIKMKWHSRGLRNVKECETFHWVVPKLFNHCWAVLCIIDNKT